MNRLKTKASRFFKDGPSADEKAAAEEGAAAGAFDAGIEKSVKKQRSFFNFKKADKSSPRPPPPPPPQIASESRESDVGEGEKNGRATGSPDSAVTVIAASTAPLPLGFPSPPVGKPERAEETPEATSDPELKKRPSLATLKTKGSRIFRSTSEATTITPTLRPVTPATPSRHLRPKSPFSIGTNRHRLSSSSERRISISRPMILPEPDTPGVPPLPSRVSFTKPPGPAPKRPARPNSLDSEIVDLMRDHSRRYLFPNTSRTSVSTSISTATASSPRSQLSRASIEARLGFPSGYSPSPFQTSFPPGSMTTRTSGSGSARSSSARLSDGRTVSEGRLLAAQRGSGKRFDGLDMGDRELGPIEQYRASREGKWVMEKRISNGGQRGTLWKDHRGMFHFVADI